MNKVGRIGLLLGIMLALVSFVVAINLSPILKELTEQGRDADHMDCSNSSISIGTRVTCMFFDLLLPLFIAAIIFSGFEYMYERLRGE